MAGQAVTIGSTISTTGSLLVNCNKPYILRVNDVDWSPVGQEGNSDLYVVTYAGFYEILVDGVRVFFFRNSIEQDFVLPNTYGRYRLDRAVVAQLPQGDPYIQTKFRSDNDYDNIEIFIPTDNAEELALLGASSNNATIQLVTTTEGSLRLIAREFDKSEYMQVNVGNVLVAFFLPSEV